MYLKRREQVKRVGEGARVSVAQRPLPDMTPINQYPLDPYLDFAASVTYVHHPSASFASPSLKRDCHRVADPKRTYPSFCLHTAKPLASRTRSSSSTVKPDWQEGLQTRTTQGWHHAVVYRPRRLLVAPGVREETMMRTGRVKASPASQLYIL